MENNKDIVLNGGAKPNKNKNAEENKKPSKDSGDDISEDTESDPVVEFQLNNLVPKSQISDFDIRNQLVRCSACGKQINHHEVANFRKHRRLGVITCCECYEFYGSSEFSQDENGVYNYCRWCGQGGKLIICDFCPNGFCSACVRRNFGRAEVSATDQQGWKCYCCDPARLKPKQRYFRLISRFGKHAKRRKDKKVSTILPSNVKDTVSPLWMQDAFQQIDTTCVTLQKKISKLKDIESTRLKSVYHVIKKMEEIMNQHKKELKSVMKVVTNHYSKYLSEQKLKTGDAENSGDSSSDVIEIHYPPTVEVMNYASESKDLETKFSCNLKKDSKMESVDTAASDDTVVGDDIAVSDALNKTLEKVTSLMDDSENEQAKRMLLENSSSGDESEPFRSATPRRPGPASCRRLHFSPSKKSTPSPDGTSSDDERTVPRRRNLGRRSGKSNFKEIVVQELTYDDPKLKMKTVVVLERCDELGTFAMDNSNSEPESKAESLPKSEELKSLERLERVIANLEKFPEIKKKAKKYDKPVEATKSSKRKPKVTKKENDGDSSSSICLSSDEERAEKPEKKTVSSKPVDPNLLARNELMESDISSSCSELDSKTEVVSKKKKLKSENKSNSSGDDFIPSKKKKKKHDKLLSARIKLLDDSDEPKEKTSRGKKSSKRKAIQSDSDDGDTGSKKKANSSSEHTTSSDSEVERNKQRQKRKLKRIKKMDSSSSNEGSDGEGKDKDGTPGKGRKNIKKIISQKKLTEETKEAQLAEKERKKRIVEKQKLYNKIQDLAEDGKEIITRKLVLEVDPVSKEEIVEISPDLIEKLKVHQVNGVRFMWESTIESLKDLEEDKPGSGCILAHCMGLGKTLQVITFLHTCMTNKHVSKKIKTAMVVCPYNTILNWANEFEMWLEGTEGNVQVHQFSAAKDNWTRLDILKWWQREGGVLIISYDIMRRLVASASKKTKSKAKSQKEFHKLLIDPGPDIVVCDEGHILKNVTSAISKAMTPMKTERRIVLTGTPLQNNLQEYHCMLSFVKPHLLGTAKEFRNRFVHPIQNGQYENSTQYDVKLMKKRTHILHKLLDGCVQRCDYSSLTKFLPPKHEFVISVKLSDVQIKMYRYYLDNISNVSQSATKGATLFKDLSNLRCIWTHPHICRTSFDRSEHRRMLNDWKNESDEEDEAFINDNSEESTKSTSEGESNEKGSSGDEVVKKYKTRSRRNKEDENGEATEEEQEEEEKAKQWFDSFISPEDRFKLNLSGKMILLVEILKECEIIGDKVIVFSTSLLTLNMIEDILSGDDTAEEMDQDNLSGSWIKGRDYFRMDGSTSADFRKTYIDMFNNPNNDRARLFLISTKAGGLGTNLVGANRVILLDASWNPSDDMQAIFRVFRFGQKKPVYIYRLLAQGTMEEKIYDRQITKLSLSFRVVDEQQIDRHFSAADLAELYTFNPEMTSNRPTPLVPKDRLLAELLIQKKEWIVTYHEHDSLLQNETEEDLTEEERQAAWNEYENEREGKTADQDFASSFNYKEPNVEEADYVGNLLPTVQEIFHSVTQRITQQNLASSMSRPMFLYHVLKLLEGVRIELQSKQVKYLRMKQEFFSKGSVPNFINKYLEELTRLMKELGVLAQTLRQQIQPTQAPKPTPAQNPNLASNMRNYMNSQQDRIRYANMQRLQEQLRGQMQGGRPKGPTYVPPSFPMYMRRGPPNVQVRMTSNQPPPPPAQTTSVDPIVTEEEEVTSRTDLPTPTNQSSVTIEEII